MNFRIDPKEFSFDINERFALRQALSIAIRTESQRVKRIKRSENAEDTIARMSDLLLRLENAA